MTKAESMLIKQAVGWKGLATLGGLGAAGAGIYHLLRKAMEGAESMAKSRETQMRAAGLPPTGR